MTHPLTLGRIEEGHLLIVGQTRSGKTYQLRGVLEQLRTAGRRVGAIDKLGNHWGLTLAADGVAAGQDFVVFGGKRAMVAMMPEQGALLGKLFVERNVPAIFDVSQWHRDDQERWVADFTDAVFRWNEGALHLGLDEAQSWVPQGGGGDAFRGVLRLAEQGLGNGIRLALTVQRLSRLDATVRNQAGLVVAMRQTGMLDRKAVAELIASDAGQAKELIDGLPGLAPGSGWLWDPGAGELARVDFPLNATFDSSRTPKHGDAPPVAAPATSALVDELRAALAPPPIPKSGKPESQNSSYPNDTIPADPAEALAKGWAVGAMLKERDDRIAALGAELAQLQNEYDLIDAEADRYSEGLTKIEEMVVRLRSGRILDLEGSRAKAGEGSVGETAPALEPVSRPVAGRSATATSELMDVTAGETATTREHRALAGLVAVWPAGLSEAAWAARTGYARKGGAWQRRRRGYLDTGLIEQRDGHWFATEAGVAQAGEDVPDLPAPGPALVAWWADRLGAPGRLLRILARVGSRGLTRDALAAEASMAAKGGAFLRHVGDLKRAELVTEAGKRLVLADSLNEEFGA